MLTITKKSKEGNNTPRLPIVDAIPIDVLDMMTQGFFQGKSLHDILQKLLAVVDALARPRTSFFLVFDPDKRELVLEGMRGRSNDTVARSCQPGEGMAGQAFVQGERVGDAGTFLAIPLRNRLSVFGVLCLCKSRQVLNDKVWSVVLGQLEAAVNMRLVETGQWRGTDPNDPRSPIHRLRAKLRAEESGAHFYNALQELLRPVSAMRSSLEVAIAQVMEAQPQISYPLQTCLRSTDRISRLLGDLLIAQRLQSGDIRLDKQPFGLRQVIREAMALFQGRDASRVFAFDEASGADIFIKGNRDQMRTALARVLENALYYNRPDCLPRIRMSITAEQRAEIVVEDDGVGIAPEELPHVFRPFFRGQGALPISGALGLGCTLARSIVLLHGGDIGIESTPGQGTRVTMSLPMYAGVVGPEVRPKGRGRHRHPYLLLVEDDEDYCDALSLLLEERGYIVERTPLAETLVERLLACPPSMVLMSLQGRQGDALRLLQHLRAQPALDCLPVFIVSGRVDSRESFEGGNFGRIDGFFMKPIDPTRFLSRIAEVLLQEKMILPSRRVDS